MGHFSPRALAAAMSRTVTRRPALPPYSGSASAAVRWLVAAVPWSSRCDVIWVLHVSRRPCGVPGPLDHDMRRRCGTACELAALAGRAGRPPAPGPAGEIRYDDVSYR